MRDPQRISAIVKRLEELWEEFPDLRLAQLIVNFQGYMGSDLYYMDDDDFIEQLEDYYHSLK